jgi:hypothetical protein
MTKNTTDTTGNVPADVSVMMLSSVDLLNEELDNLEKIKDETIRGIRACEQAVKELDRLNKVRYETVHAINVHEQAILYKTAEFKPGERVIDFSGSRWEITSFSFGCNNLKKSVDYYGVKIKKDGTASELIPSIIMRTPLRRISSE